MFRELLEEAQALYEAGELREAARTVKDYLRDNQKDVEGWWLLALITEDPTKQLEWVKRVLRLQPDHEEARELMIELGGEPPPLPKPLATPDAEIPKKRRKKKTKQPREKKTYPAGRGEWVASVVLFVLINGLLAGGAYYGYNYRHMGLFGLFGPDLTASIGTDEFAINYPSDWYGETVTVGDETRLVISDHDVNASVLASSISPDLTPADLLFSEGRLLAQVLGVQGNVENAVVMVMTPVTSDVLVPLVVRTTDRRYQTMRHFLTQEFAERDESSAEGETEARIRVGHEELSIEVDGHSWHLTYVFRDLRAGDYETHIGTYYAVINYGDEETPNAVEEIDPEEYLLVLTVYGDESDNYENTLRRILRTVEFK